ncbi:NHL repeat-containing protein [Aurantivibrio plasticivorans]
MTIPGYFNKTRRPILLGAAALASIITLGALNAKIDHVTAAEGGARMAPAFEVDPFWPKPLPNHWILGRTIGVAVDSRDHVYIVHRDQNNMFGERTEIGLKTGVSECCTPAPPVLEFDPEGNLVNAWGGPGEGYSWPASNHGIEIAPNGDVWIGGNGSGDSHVLVFSRDGKFLKEIGKAGESRDSNSTEHFSMVAEIAIDAKSNEAYIADGYGNKRVAVVDASSGDFKRYWGAYGNKPEDVRIRYNPDEPLPQQFIGPVHCAEPSKDGLVYVCDRGANRIQVFKTDGTFVKEKQIAPKTLAQGAIWDIAFSQDPEQKFIFVADGQNMRVYVVERQSLEVLTSFGDGGRQPGQFYAVHSIVSDSKGNLYTTETYEGKRVQKFNYKGLKKISAENQGVVWPSK